MRRLVLAAAGCCVLMVLVALVVIPATEQTTSEVAVAFSSFALAFALVGAVVLVLRPGNVVGRLMLLVGVLGSLSVLAGQYAGHALFGGGDLPLAREAAWLTTWLYVLAIGAVTHMLLAFPGGALPGWRRRMVGIAGIVTVVTAVLQAVEPGEMDGFPGIANPLALTAVVDVLRAALAVATAAYLVAFLVAVGSIFARLRRAEGVERQQLKWFALSAALFVASQVANVLPLGLDDSWLGLVTVVLSLLAMPLAIGLAVLRYRLYDVDVVIKRTLVYGTLTVALVTTYLGLVLVLQSFLRPVSGDSDLAVAVSTLAVAALFRPLRSQIKRGVDRRFYRERYDAVRTLEGFSARLREELDLDSLGADLRQSVRDTVQPTHVVLWLRGTP